MVLSPVDEGAELIETVRPPPKRLELLLKPNPAASTTKQARMYTASILGDAIVASHLRYGDLTKIGPRFARLVWSAPRTSSAATGTSLEGTCTL
jgi:hypothetical protein